MRRSVLAGHLIAAVHLGRAQMNATVSVATTMVTVAATKVAVVMLADASALPTGFSDQKVPLAVAAHLGVRTRDSS
jgi:hypothetical protein